jgi:DNA-directed RNA polymerase specialized sigma24 family protein
MTEAELWKVTFKRLVAWTARRHRMTPADAEDIVQDAIRLFLKAGGQPDPADPKGLFYALGSNVNGIMVNKRRNKVDRAVSLMGDVTEAELGDPDTEARIADAQVARKAVSAVFDRVSGDELASQVMMLQSEGMDDAASQAKHLGVNVTEVYNARRRLKGHVEAIQKLAENW